MTDQVIVAIVIGLGLVAWLVGGISVAEDPLLRDRLPHNHNRKDY